MSDEPDVYAPPAEDTARGEIGPTEPEATDGPRGIGGWLLLPLLGLILTPIRVGYALVTEYVPIFENDWEVLVDETFADYHPLWAPLLVYEVAGSLILAGMSLIGLGLLALRERRFPMLMIALYAVNVAYLGIDLLAAQQIPALVKMGDPQALQDLARAVVVAAIWIPYFLRSRRVRNTFIR